MALQGRAVRGLDILVYQGDTVLGSQQNCTLSMESESIDCSNKNSFGWSDFIAGAKSWSIECEGQFVSTEQEALMTAFVDATFVQIEMKNEDESIYFAGEAMVESIEIEASYDDVATYSVSFVGKGALQVKKSA